jgi:hypothetical protein
VYEIKFKGKKHTRFAVKCVSVYEIGGNSKRVVKIKIKKKYETFFSQTENFRFSFRRTLPAMILKSESANP